MHLRLRDHGGTFEPGTTTHARLVPGWFGLEYHRDRVDNSGPCLTAICQIKRLANGHINRSESEPPDKQSRPKLLCVFDGSGVHWGASFKRLNTSPDLWDDASSRDPTGSARQGSTWHIYG